MKVNMTPNPLDVVTIHASQGDTEARQWEFELHNNGELIDTSDVKEQLVFKAYKGGTEQLLPENTSTPTTSPFKGDIKYPQGLLTDQEFTYRQSPTESDGLAKITDIKGNTLVWNQQIDSSQYRTGTYSSVAVTKSADETYLIANGTASAVAYIRLFNVASVPMISGHKYCCIVPTDQDVAYYDDSSPRQYSNQYSSFIFTSNGNPIRPHARINSGVASTNRRISFMMFDLTQMGLDSLTVEEFTSLFPLPYYSYNQGSLLSFNGNGIKTVGKNLIEGISQGAVGTHGETNSNANRLRVDGFVRVLQGEQYTFSASKSASTNLQIYTRFFADNDGSEQISYLDWLTLPRAITIPNGINYATFTIRYQTSTAITPSDIYDVQLELGSSATSYEPYTSSTTDLPISTYFPQGMKSVGDVYDELTEAKAITRVGSRAYQSGDESDTSVITDGTTTYYALATPTETSFTTASLVTENAEIPLSAENDVLIGKCTEELSAEPGFHDAKIKLADEDGECYSNKIQLHVERSPQ